MLGADLAFGNPLRRLSAAVQSLAAWRAVRSQVTWPGAPDEVLQLAHSFQEATGSLRQREAELTTAQERQDLLVLEVHHRVKNNLQVIASLLNLQASRIRVPEAQAEFQAARGPRAARWRHCTGISMPTASCTRSTCVRSWHGTCAGQLFQAMGETEGARIQMQIEAPELRMSSDQAVPLALIVTEAVTNSVRYAFPGGRSGKISVLLRDLTGSST